ncbi:MAG: single-stranded DNA-binding protein [Nitrospirae bacterium]|nr:single-stranded DNA-binding protein [Magnetococcales bacterium]HAT51164.1 single-stranded DNA-binding protein [Alphaproteobacteria bacterium]
MSRSLNKVQLIGNLGADPEIRATKDGKPVATLNIATSESWNDAQGQKQEKTEWHRVVVFGRLAGIVQQYLRKGSKIFIEGKLQTRKWTDKQGLDRYTTEVVLGDFSSQMIMLDGSRSQGTPYSGGGGGSSSPSYDPSDYGSPAASFNQGQNVDRGFSSPPSYSNNPPASPPPARAPVAPSANIPDFDDDIPF